VKKLVVNPALSTGTMYTKTTATAAPNHLLIKLHGHHHSHAQPRKGSGKFR
jgi:hypothetical protein